MKRIVTVHGGVIGELHHRSSGMSLCSRNSSRVMNACLGPHGPRGGFVDNDLENHTGGFSFSFYFSRFALFLLGSIRAWFGTGEARGFALPLQDW
jgi:hypothetical protein